jgi:hypothetical protein
MSILWTRAAFCFAAQAQTLFLLLQNALIPSTFVERHIETLPMRFQPICVSPSGISDCDYPLLP